ncbi:MAG: MotA/TolQ/ExbB proton channel family protein [Gemmatimonadota bacterium]
MSETPFRILADGGFVMYPLFVIVAAILVLIARGAWRVGAGESSGGAEGADPALEVGIDAILFWGAFGVVVGVVGTLVGIVEAAQAMELAGEVSPALAWGGIKVSLIPTIFSLLVFGIAVLGWFVLRTVYRRRLYAARRPDAAPASSGA